MQTMPEKSTHAYGDMAEKLRGFGRGDDTMLIHMTPNEVNSLQGLALASGGSLTINPHTGLPEAGWLGKLLPTILGVLGAAVGIPTWAIGLGGAAIGTAVTGDLSKGLMAGLGAYGGAGIGNAVGLGGALSKNAFGILGGGASNAATSAATSAVANSAPGASGIAQPLNSVDISQLTKTLPALPPTSAIQSGVSGLGQGISGMGNGAEQLLGAAQQTGAGIAAAAPDAAKGLGFLDKYKAATNIAGTGNIGAMAGGYGVLNNISEAMKQDFKGPEESKWNYEGPYAPTKRTVIMPTTTAKERKGAEHQWFDDVNPMPGYEPYSPGSVSPGAAGTISVLDAVRSRQQDRVNERNYAMGGPVQRPNRMYAMRRTPGAPAAMPNQLNGGGMGALQQGGGAAMMPAPQASPMASAPTSAPMPAPPASPMAAAPTSAPQTPPMPVPQAPPMAGRPSNMMGFAQVPSTGFARGGEVQMDDGAFVFDARTVSELGNGSSNAGMELLSRMGGSPVRGTGDGVSDSVPARINGGHPARVARDEVVMPARVVKQIGSGSAKRGADKLYDLMNRAHTARKTAKRGQDTKLRKGLA